MPGAFAYRMPVRFADVDHAGIVYYPRFFHYFHVTFEEMFRQRMGARAYVELLDTERIGFPAVASECQYFSPLRFGDTAEIRMSVEHLGARSIRFRYRVYRLADNAPEPGHRADQPQQSPRQPPGSPSPEGPVLAAEGTNTCAVVDLERFRAVPIPDPLRALLADLLEPESK